MAELYRVTRPRASGRSATDERAAKYPCAAYERDPDRPRAVFVAHGMGQQVPFQTLDDLARGLCGTLEAHGIEVEERNARTIRVGCERLQQLELKLKSSGGEALPPVHLYEAYWAPLTEGAIGLWQVVRFLLAGGWNGIRSDARLRRFMFGKPRQFHISRWELMFLIVVVLTVIAMLVVGGTIAAVAVARLTFEEKSWVTLELIGDLTILFELLLGVIAGSLAVAVALIALSRRLMQPDPATSRSRVARAINWLTLIPGVAIVLALGLSAYVAIPVLFMFDEKPPFPARDCAWCTGVFHGWGGAIGSVAGWIRRLVDRVLHCPLPERAAWWVLVGTALVVVFYAVHGLVAPRKQPGGRGGRHFALVLALLVTAGFLALCGWNDALAFVTWLLLFAAVVFVRSFLIQYLGDVAIYVSPHLVDRFFDLRVRIRNVVWRAARAVYSYRDATGFVYDDVIVAGHSLGSVVVYDALNRLVNDDDLADESDALFCDDAPVENLCVSARTRLLLTFGSPLDKTAFIFAQHDPHGGTERDALAASVQPLIAREREFRWVNVWTRFDILGGCLDFYDTPQDDEDPNFQRVDNVPDPHAITPLLAHTEFWKNTLIYEKIFEALDLDS